MPSRPSKFNYDVNLFTSEPPRELGQVKSLFCGRDRELVRGASILKNCLDIKGKRARKHDKRPWIIHGESRCGKSHLARRILADLPRNPKRLQITIPAREQLDASLVLRNLLAELRDAFEVRRLDQSNAEDLSKHPRLEGIREAIEHVELFFEGRDPASLKLTKTRSTKLTTQAGFKTSLSKVVDISGSQQGDDSSESKIELTLPAPTPDQLAELCGMMVDALIEVGRLDHCLILVDDVDLLEGYTDPVRNASRERSLLARALCNLHATPGVDVLLTARTWYANTKKEFVDLVDLTTSELSSDDLVNIHDRRFKAFRGRLPGAFLSGEALAQAAEDAQGLPGIFLQQLGTAFRRYQSETEWGERSYDWYLDAFQTVYQSYQRKFPGAAKLLEAAALAGQLQIDVTEGNPFRGTPLESEFVFPSYYNEAIYLVPGLMHKVVSRCITP